MNARILLAILLPATIALGAFGTVRYRSSRPPLASPPPAVAEPDKHKVTPSMSTEAEKRVKTLAPKFRKVDAEGAICDLAEMLKTGPLVLLFIKDGCPCSVSAEAYFNQLHASYRGRARFLGVIDGDAAVARRWASANGVPFPIVPDPKLELTHAFGATNSAYVAVIDRSGSLDAFWPGYSVAMLHDLNARIASLSGLPEQPIETPDAPEEMYSGCPFAEPIPALPSKS